MRSCLILLVCLAALAGGVGLAVVAAGHLPEIAKAWNAGTVLYDTAASQSKSTSASGANDGSWKPPATIPAHPNWTWYTHDGNVYRNVVITEVGPNDVTITHSLGVAHISPDLLPADVRNELESSPGAATPTAAPPTSTTDAPSNELTPVAAMVQGKLVDSTGQVVPTPGSSIKYYAIYYSASWCPPCHMFTPTLVSWYRGFKPSHRDFELIFVSEDRDESSMFGYMTEMQMPWPAVKYSELPRTDGTFRGPGIQQFANTGIPDLVLVDSSGAVLADSFSSSTYVGPQSVIDYMNSKL
jgi:nucleoredoxin